MKNQSISMEINENSKSMEISLANSFTLQRIPPYEIVRGSILHSVVLALFRNRLSEVKFDAGGVICRSSIYIYIRQTFWGCFKMLQVRELKRSYNNQMESAGIRRESTTKTTECRRKQNNQNQNRRSRSQANI